MFAIFKRFMLRRVRSDSAVAACLPHLVGAVALVLGTVAHAAIPAAERQVLLNIYAYTNGINWDQQYQVGWNGSPGTECTWYGITCDASSSTVTGIDLAGVGMYGMLPSLSGLSNLESFDIRQTAHSGIGAYNSLYGPMPSLVGLKKLHTFLANNTFFSGSLPSFSGLTELVDFEVFNCTYLGGPIPSLDVLTNLEQFDVHNDQLSGQIPALAGLKNLVDFRADTNHLTGVIPELSGLPDLTNFDVGGNQLTGSVPELASLPNLQQFFAGSNLLNGTLGGWENLPQLLEFAVGYNRLTGSIPPVTGAPKLQNFDVSRNRLSGGIPNLTQLNDLTALGVAVNQLTGSLPAPPSSLVAAGANSTGGAYLCPNLLTPATSPPSTIDMDWSTASRITPWSRDCAPNPKWPSFLHAYSSRNPSLVGQPVTFNALVMGMNPTGTVTFTSKPDGPNNEDEITTLCDSVPLVDSIATCTVSDFAANSSNVIVATYSGDANNEPADNGIGPIFGNVDISTIDLLVSDVVDAGVTANPAQVGQPVDLTATLTGGSEENTVTFQDGRLPLCTDVAEHTVQGHQVAHCVTTFSKVGVHMLTALENGSFISMSIPTVEHVVASAPFDADQFALTGSWYNPAISGQGLELEVYPDFNGTGSGVLFAGWFTYDDAGNPQWLTLSGELTAGHGSSYALDVVQNTGGNFNAAPITQGVKYGTATLNFYDCTHAALAYQFNDGRSGTIAYVRLTAPTGCSSEVPAMATSTLPANYNDVLHAGAWFDPATSGQGLNVDIVPSQTTFFATWYTYAPQFEGLTGPTGLRWFTLQDNTYTPGDLHLHDVPIGASSGGVFGVPSDVATTQVGTADIDFTSCATMTLNYTFTQGEFAGLSGTVIEHAIRPKDGCR